MVSFQNEHNAEKESIAVSPQQQKISKPIRVLNVFSKVFEKVINKQLMLYLENTLSIFIAAYRERYGNHHV